jgi:hypothetical protein
MRITSGVMSKAYCRKVPAITWSPWGWPSVRGSGSELLKRATSVKRLGWYPYTARRYTQLLLPRPPLRAWCRQLLVSSAVTMRESWPRCVAVHSKRAVWGGRGIGLYIYMDA